MTEGTQAMEKVKLEVVTPAKVVLRGEVDMVILPGTEGEFGVLIGHAPLLSGIVPGELRYAAGSEKGFVALSAGFAEVFRNRVSVLVDAAEMSAEIDVERAKRALSRAKEKLEQDRSNKEIDFLRAESAMKRAMARVRVAERAQVK
jgi:F-type H+-transporting ATPase subunit epsilon